MAYSAFLESRMAVGGCGTATENIAVRSRIGVGRSGGKALIPEFVHCSFNGRSSNVRDPLRWRGGLLVAAGGPPWKLHLPPL